MFSISLVDGWSNCPSLLNHPRSLATREPSLHIHRSHAHGSHPTCTRPCLSVTPTCPPSSGRFSWRPRQVFSAFSVMPQGSLGQVNFSAHPSITVDFLAHLPTEGFHTQNIFGIFPLSQDHPNNTEPLPSGPLDRYNKDLIHFSLNLYLQ